MPDGNYTISTARYAKGMKLVRIPSENGFKTRAARLLGAGLRARYPNREAGYGASPAKTAKFERRFAAGWAAAALTGALLAPEERR